MKPIILNDKTKDFLKQLDAQIKATNEQFQQVVKQFQDRVQSLQSQKGNILGVITLERNIPETAKIVLNADYNLEFVDEKKFNELAANPSNVVLETSKAEVPLNKEAVKKPFKKRK